MVCVFAVGKGVWRWAWCCCNARFLSRVRARVLYIWCLGVTSAWHVWFFIHHVSCPIFSLIGFKVGGVNAEKGVSCGVHKARLLTYAVGEWGICSARLVVW